MTYVLIAIVALYYVLLVRSHVRPYLLLRVKGNHMKYLPMAALLAMFTPDQRLSRWPHG